MSGHSGAHIIAYQGTMVRNCLFSNFSANFFQKNFFFQKTKTENLVKKEVANYERSIMQGHSKLQIPKPILIKTGGFFRFSKINRTSNAFIIGMELVRENYNI